MTYHHLFVHEPKFAVGVLTCTQCWITEIRALGQDECPARLRVALDVMTERALLAETMLADLRTVAGATGGRTAGPDETTTEMRAAPAREEWQAVAERWCVCSRCDRPATHVDESGELVYLYCAVHQYESEDSVEMHSPADTLAVRLREERARALEEAAEDALVSFGGATAMHASDIYYWIDARANNEREGK